MKQYITLYNRAILTKTKKTTFISQIRSIKRANLNLKVNIITNLIILLEFLLKHFFNIKDVLYIIKKAVGP